jgi:hypothetical protein
MNAFDQSQIAAGVGLLKTTIKLLAREGYPRKAGHPTLSTTSRHDLIALPRSRQVFDLR